MKKLVISILILIFTMSSTFTGFAGTPKEQDVTETSEAPSWAYESNDNIPESVDKYGNPIPNIVINENMILVDVYGKWSQEAITYCGKQGYLEGMLVRKVYFHPEWGIDKCDLAIFCGRMENIEYGIYLEEYFSDIRFEDYDLSESYDYTDWYKNLTPYYVSWAGQEGLLKGNSSGKLSNTYGRMTREEAATILDRYITKKTNLYEKVDSDGGLKYKDSEKISDWAQDSVERMTRVKLLNGDQNGNFNPAGGISRAEICQIIFNLAQAESLSAKSR